MKNNKVLFHLLLAAQVFVLVLMMASYYAVDWSGKEIHLKTAPVDPRDLFYGDYVILNYEISTLPASLWKEKTPPDPGTPVYVVLQRNGEYDQAVSVSSSKPPVQAGQSLLKGKVQYAEMLWDEKSQKDVFQSIRVQYGLERYYVPEGSGKEIEKKRESATVIVKTAPWGQSKISRLDFP